MKILSFTDSERDEQVLLVELERAEDGTVRATWHDEGYRNWIEHDGVGVMGDAGKMVIIDSAAMLYRYAARLYATSSMFEVDPG